MPVSSPDVSYRGAERRDRARRRDDEGLACLMECRLGRRLIRACSDFVIRVGWHCDWSTSGWQESRQRERPELVGLICSVAGAFFAFVISGWAAGSLAGVIAGAQRARQSFHAARPPQHVVIRLAGFGTANFLGGWYGGLAGTPIWATSSTMTAAPNAAVVARNSALGAGTALLIGLIGSVIGGWMASGEPMSLAYRGVKQEIQPNHAVRSV